MVPFFLFDPNGPIYNPQYNDPAKFPRAAPILDDESIVRISQIERLLEQSENLTKDITKLQDELGIIRADIESVKARLFPRLRELYPETVKGYAYGWRKFDENYYCVGWDNTSPSVQEA